MKKTEWFKRTFPPIEDNGLMPGIVERLDGTPARLWHKSRRMPYNMRPLAEGKWSIKKEIGHLIDLEPLWLSRMQQILKGESDLLVADLTNAKTHQTDYDSEGIFDLLSKFDKERSKMMYILKNLHDDELEKSALHPRLKTPMRLIDLAFFVAEHDDHHLAQITALSYEFFDSL